VTSPDAGAPPTALPRALPLLTAIGAVIGIMVGSGIFRVPTSIAALVGEPWAILALWVAGGALALCLALLLSELAAMFPQAGGMYVFLREAFGDAVAFVYGWTYLLVNPAAWATIAMACAEFIGYFVPLDDQSQRFVAMGIIAVLCAINVVSTRWGAAAQNLSTGTKFVMLLALVGLVFGYADGRDGAFALAAAEGGVAPAFSAWLLALVAVLWAFDGFAGFCALAGEVRDPQRNLPRALLLGVSSVTVLYLLVNAALLYALPVDRIAATALALALAVEFATGPVAALIVAGLVVIATLSSLAGCVLSDPRVFFAAARDGLFFRRIGAIQPRFVTPANAIVLHGLLACVYASARTFDQLAATFVLGIVPFYTLAALAAWRLRRSQPGRARPYRAPLAPLLACIWCSAALLVMGNALIESPLITGINLAISAVGLPVYWLWRRR
jgi:basic amino acid/polyamine antiporter, APA family